MAVPKKKEKEKEEPKIKITFQEVDYNLPIYIIKSLIVENRCLAIDGQSLVEINSTLSARFNSEERAIIFLNNNIEEPERVNFRVEQL